MIQRKWQALDADGNVIDIWVGPKKESRIGTEWNGGLVDTIVPYQEPVSPQQERAEAFSRTLDIMNPVWYNSLTTEQQTELAAWRQAWLDYPETGVRPDDLSFM